MNSATLRISSSTTPFLWHPGWIGRPQILQFRRPLWVCNQCRMRIPQSSTKAYHCLASCEALAMGSFKISTKEPSSWSLIWRRMSTASKHDLQQSRKGLNEEDLQRSPTEGNAQPPKDESPLAGEKLQTLVATVRHNWNDLVGYTDIEKQREKVEAQEQLIRTKRIALQEARDSYRSAVEKHATSLRDSRDLLARKDEWSEKDAIRFTTLHQAVRANEVAEKTTRQASTAAELDLERETERLGVTIGKVYQAESMYNSKIIQMKTWWTWALMALNASVFLINVYLIQVGLSPRSRRAVGLSDEAITRIKDAVLEASRAEDASQYAFKTPQAVAKAEIENAVPLSEPLTKVAFQSTERDRENNVQGYRSKLYDLFSNRPVTVRVVDITTATLQGAFVGMLLVSLGSKLFRGT